MRLIVVLTVMIGCLLSISPILNVSAGNYKINEPIWGTQSTQNSNTDILFTFPMRTGDNLTINITSVSGSGGLAFGQLGGGGECTGWYLLYSSTSDTTTANQAYINFPAITVPYKFWIVSASDQNICIHSVRNAASSIQYTINKINATLPQDPAIKILQNQVKNLQMNMTIAQNQISTLTQQIYIMTLTDQQILTNITNLWKSYNKLNVSLNALIQTVNDFKASTSQNITWIEQNITKIKADIYDIQHTVNDLSTKETSLTSVQNQVNKTVQDISQINSNVTQIRNSIVYLNNDTALKNQIAQLQKENAQLRSNIDTLNKTKQEKIIETRPDNALTVGAWVLAIFGIVIALIAMAMVNRKPRTPSLEEIDDEPPKSEEYEKIDDEGETKGEIPMAKAKMKDEENLDDVMKRLKE